MYDAGTAALSVIPDFKGVETAIRQQASKWGLTAGQAFGKTFQTSVRAQVKDMPVGPAPAKTRRQGTESGGSFADGFKQRVKSALRDLPPIEIGAATTEAEQKLRDLRVQLQTLADQTVGVDVDATAALAEVQRIQQQLDELGRQSPDVQVRADTAAASAQLAAITAQVEKLAHTDPSIDVDVDAGPAVAQLAAVGSQAGLSTSRLGTLIGVGASIAPMIVPAAAAAAAAVGAIGPAAAAGVAGLGVAILGFSGVTDAVKAMSAAQADAGKSAVQLAQRQSQVAAAADQVRSAERALANTRASNADAARRAAQQVADAERSVARAQEQARQATLDLARAREEERRANQDLAFNLEETQIAQRQANLDLADAKTELDRVLANPRATEAQKEAAQIAYDEIELRVRQLAVQQQRLADEQKKTAQVGVDGSDRVQAAQRRVRDTTEGVADAQRDLAEAVAGQQSQQRQAAFALANAQQSVIDAQRSLQQATVSAGTAGVASMDKLNESMAALSPAGQRFSKFIFGLKDEFLSLRATAAEGLLPGVQKAIEILLPYLPKLRDFIGRVAKVMGDLAVESAKALTGPQWRSFFGFVNSVAVPAMVDLVKMAGNVALGFANLLVAFLPVSKDMGGGLLDLTKRFADWSAGLKNDQGFQDFLGYVRTNGPKLVGFLGDTLIIVGKLGIALAPLGQVMLDVFGWIADWLAKADPSVLLGIALAISTIVAVVTGTFAAVAIAVAGFIGLWVLAYTKLDWFRTAVNWWFGLIGDTVMWLWRNAIQPAFEGIADAATWLWNSVLKPAFTAITGFVRDALAPAFMWFWHNIIEPVWAGVQYTMNIAWSLIKVVLGLFEIGIKALGWAISTWYNTVVKPVWNWVYDRVIKPVWDKVRPIFDAMIGWVRDKIPPAFRAAVDAIGKAWDRIRDVAKVPVKFVVETVINKAIIDNFNKLAKTFGVDQVDRVPLPAGFAAGGILPGYTPGRDVHLFHSATAGALALSGGEAIIRPEGTRVLGADWVSGINQAARTGGPAGVRRWLGGFADGGILDTLSRAATRARDMAGDAISNVTGLFTDPVGTLRKLINEVIGLTPGKDSAFGQLAVGVPQRLADAVLKRVGEFFTGSEGGGVAPGGLGWQRMMQILRGQFPGLPLISGFRPGAITATGNKSYHSVGRAVDLPPRMDVFEWIHQAYPNSRELIFSPAGGRQIHNGRPHMYTGVTRNMHWDHVHWAYDQGGWLPPGMTQVVNQTGQPEAVLTGPQWQAIQRAANIHGEARAAREYHFQFRDTTLSPSKLRALQDREDALALAGRPV